MGLHALIVPRGTEPVSRKTLYERLVSAGLRQHPNAKELETSEERAAWRFTLSSDNAGIVSVEESEETLTGAYAEARIPGTSDSQVILNWAHHLWSLAEKAGSDVFFGDRRMFAVLAAFCEAGADDGMKLTARPPFQPLFETAQTALHNAKQRYSDDNLASAISDLQHHRQTIFLVPPVRINSDSAFAAENPDHPCASGNRFRRQKAADFFKLLAVASPKDFTDEVLRELHESLFDRDPAVRMTVSETLGLLRRHESVPYLQRLIDSEDESDWVRNAARESLAVCSAGLQMP